MPRKPEVIHPRKLADTPTGQEPKALPRFCCETLMVCRKHLIRSSYTTYTATPSCA